MIQGQVPLWLLMLLLGLFLSAIVFCSTTNDRPPKYHPVRIHLDVKRTGGRLMPCFRCRLLSEWRTLLSCDHVLSQQWGNVPVAGVCSVGLHRELRADQCRGLRGGQCPAHAGRGAQPQQHRVGAHALGLGQQHRRWRKYFTWQTSQ